MVGSVFLPSKFLILDLELSLIFFAVTSAKAFRSCCVELGTAKAEQLSRPGLFRGTRESIFRTVCLTGSMYQNLLYKESTEITMLTTLRKYQKSLRPFSSYVASSLTKGSRSARV